MIVKTVIHGLIAAATVATAGWAWAEMGAPAAPDTAVAQAFPNETARDPDPAPSVVAQANTDSGYRTGPNTAPATLRTAPQGGMGSGVRPAPSADTGYRAAPSLATPGQGRGGQGSWMGLWDDDERHHGHGRGHYHD